MQKKITTTTASNPLGGPSSRTLLKITEGNYAGRRIAILATGSNEINLYWSDTPNHAWSSPLLVANDAADSPFDTLIIPGGDIYVTYIENTTDNLVFKKLTLNSSSWSVGSKVTVYNIDSCSNPSLVRESSGKIWLCWTNDVSATQTVRVKSSTDDGATFGSGPTDSGTAVSGGSASAIGRLLLGPSVLNVIYTDNGTGIYQKSIPLAGGSWSSAYTIASGTGFDSNFDCDGSSDGWLGVLYDDGEVKYRDFDGVNWSAVQTIDSIGGQIPQIRFVGRVPVLSYLPPTGADDAKLRSVDRVSGSFGSPEAFDQHARQFDSVFLYSAAYADTADLTSKSGGSFSAELFHPSSSTLFDAIGDTVYLGLDQRFRFLHIELSTVGAGGTIEYAYWDGANWKAFTPVDTKYAFDQACKDVRLWADYNSIPSDWGRRLIDTTDRFWIRLNVSAAFTTAPIGSTLTTISPLTAISLGRS